MPPSTYFKYDKHEQQWDNHLSDPEQRKLGDTWFNTATLDAWRHARMYEPLRTLVQANPDASWLTVGDGRYGTDAHFLLSAGAQAVHATDISDKLLKVASARGFITGFSAENAEALRFDDNAFDYVYCKESLHHFPRPAIALYEMFRVARRAVILTEPRDKAVDRAPLARLLDSVKALLGRRAQQHFFEPVGNYVFAISEREIDKFLLAMHYTDVAYTGCNDAYDDGVAFVPLPPQTAEHRKIKAAIERRIRRQDWLCRLRITNTGLLTAALFKQAPTPELAAALRAGAWEVRQLPSNPYLDAG